MNAQETCISRESLQSLQEDLRKLKHDMNNTFAVFLALAELAERNPVNYERLAKAVLDRCPKVVEELQSFQESLANAIDVPLIAPSDNA
jgi:hypothetical protein